MLPLGVMIAMVCILVIILVALMVVALRLRWAFTRFMPHAVPMREAREEDLPTVSICIPARNEKHAMTGCLEAIVATQYPKLEVIVLDDGSRDDTSLLIKSFAHAGVRFVEGTPLPSGWLGKNHALDTLLHESSGQYILFMDVDTRIRPQTVSQLVAYITNTKADMVSVMPQRYDGWRMNVVFATMRFFWEIASRHKQRPATMSSAWMIKRSVLADELGGIAMYKAATRPEAELSRVLNQSGRYRFVISGAWLGMRYEKRWSSQIETSIRLSYPWFGYSWLRSLTAICGLLICLTPYFYMAEALYMGSDLLFGIALFVVLCEIALYSWFVSKVWPRGWIVGGIVLPILLIIEVYVVFISAWRYSRGNVTWKGRSIASTAHTTVSENAS
jgi:glycosyltransferase involved in cell wall biosynthesis